MTYLIAKFTLLFLLASILGFALGHWFARRRFVDVSESFEDLRKANDRSDQSSWNRLWERLDAIPEPKEADLSSVLKRLDNVEYAILRLPKPEPINLESIENRLDALDNSIGTIPVPLMPAPVDLAPVTSKLGKLEHRVGALSRPQSVDLAPFDQRLKAIEKELESLGQRIAQRKATESAPRKTDIAPREASREEPRILKAALYGNKDDLKLISGVGPKLERLLNENGVFYFWQVASWSNRDIDIIDDRLDVFKGRIARDGWVSQAKHLKRQPDAARTPTE